MLRSMRILTLKVLITTATDNILIIFCIFRENDVTFHVNRLLDDPHEIPSLMLFEK